MLSCSSLSDQSINDSHSSAVEKWTVHHEFANTASASVFFFDSKWGVINLDLFLYASFCLERMIHWLFATTHCSSTESHSTVTTNLFLGFNKKHYLLFLKNNNITEKTPCENFRFAFSMLTPAEWHIRKRGPITTIRTQENSLWIPVNIFLFNSLFEIYECDEILCSVWVKAFSFSK